jgi:hypothetical protein
VQDGALPAVEERWRGGWRYRIERYALNRYLLRDWLDRQMCEFRFGEGPDPTDGTIRSGLGGLGRTFVYGSGMTTQRLPRFELDVSIDDLWCFAFQQPLSADSLAELRARVGVSDGAFETRFILKEKETTTELAELVRRVQLPRLPGEEPDELRQRAIMHVIYYVLPRLRQIAQKPTHYILRSVKNFYIEEARRAGRRRREVPSERADIAYGDPIE